MKWFTSALILLLSFSSDSAASERRRRISISGTSNSVSAEEALVPHWYDGVSVGNMDNSADWQEQSGLATARLAENADYMWTLSDAPANMLAAVLLADGSNQGVWTFESPPTYVDLEDVESQVVDGQPYLYVFDFGNNGNGADSRGAGIDLRILRAKEPAITGSNGEIDALDYIEIDVAYPVVGGPTLRDAEAAIVEEDGTINIIIKRDAVQKLYSLPHAESYSGTQTLTYEGDIWALPESRTHPLTTTPCFVVDAAMSPDGTEVLVKGYDKVFYYPRDSATQTMIQVLQQTGIDVPAYVGGGTYIDAGVYLRASHPSQEPQGEGIAFSPDGRDWYSNSEYLTSEGSSATRYPFFKYARAAAVPTTVSFQTGVSPSAAYTSDADGTSDTYIWDTNPTTDNGGATTVITDKAVGVETDQRKGLLKFNLTPGAIPANAVVIGSRVNTYTSMEGQGFVFYKILTANWTEASTYDLLTGGVNDDGVEASATEEARNGVNHNGLTGFMRNNISFSTVQSWVNGTSPNYGWLIEGTDIAGGDGLQFDSSEGATAGRRPELEVRYYVP